MVIDEGIILRTISGVVVFLLLLAAISYNDQSGGVFRSIQMIAAMVVYPQHANFSLFGHLIGEIVGYSIPTALIVWLFFRKQKQPSSNDKSAKTVTKE
jgi:hypothetical protein